MSGYDNYKRVTIFAGHYGSGKTNLAINYAFMLRRYLDCVSIVDLDIVNPYFRTKDSEDVIKKSGIRVISSSFANSNVDLPSIPAEAYAIIEDDGHHIVVDVGGDDRGALALGRYMPGLRKSGDFEMILVVNKYRPLTRDSGGAVEILREIEAASGLPFTGIINNSNLGPETTADTVLSSIGYADEISQITGLPVKMTAVRDDICDMLYGRIEDIFPIKLYHSSGGRFLL
ncbi:MAG: hypothetical protein ACOX1Q_07225 [Eubacteriales bacterium]|jgi:hypothetical protein